MEGYCNGQIFVLFIGSLVFVVDSLDLHCDLLNLIESGIVHSFLEGVLPDEFFDVEAGFLEVDFEEVDFFPDIQDGILVNVVFDSGLGGRYLCSFSARSLSCWRSSYFSPSSKMRALSF